MNICIVKPDFKFHDLKFIDDDYFYKNRNYGFKRLMTKHTSDELYETLKEYNPDGIIAGLETYDKKILDACPNLKVISRVGSGIDNIDLEEAKKRNIKILSTPQEPVEAVAELVIAQMINLLRDIPHYHSDPMGVWNRTNGKRLSDCTIGIIGFGRIGQRVCKLLQAFKCKKIYVKDIRDFSDFNEFNETYENGIKYNCISLETLLHESDIVTLHIPLNPPDNKNFINKDLLKYMKKDAFLINTSRGGIINEKDLYNFLKNGKIKGAYLDVFSTEPYHGLLRTLKNVIYTPHIGAFTQETRAEMEFKAFKNCVEFLKSV